MIRSKSKANQSGQILLLIILLSTALLTVALSISQISTQETRVARLEEQSKAAFAAAEAGIEAALELNAGESLALESLGLGGSLSGQAEVITSTETIFTTPLIHKDEAYTFYLSNFNPQSGEFDAGANASPLSVNVSSPELDSLCDTERTTLALELTFINREENRITARRLIDPCDSVSNHESEGAVDEVIFGDVIDTSSFPSHILFMRVLAPDPTFLGARFTVHNETPGGSTTWPSQGKTVLSQATVEGEVSKRIRLFQSHPQMPADFLVTSF